MVEAIYASREQLESSPSRAWTHWRPVALNCSSRCGRLFQTKCWSLVLLSKSGTAESKPRVVRGVILVLAGIQPIWIYRVQAFRIISSLSTCTNQKSHVHRGATWSFIMRGSDCRKIYSRLSNASPTPFWDIFPPLQPKPTRGQPQLPKNLANASSISPLEKSFFCRCYNPARKFIYRNRRAKNIKYYYIRDYQYWEFLVLFKKDVWFLDVSGWHSCIFQMKHWIDLMTGLMQILLVVGLRQSLDLGS